MKQTIEFKVPATLHLSSFVRHTSETIFEMAGFNKEWGARLKLVVDELFMNAVRYGSTENTSTVFIQFDYDDSEVTFTIHDDGTGSKKTTAEELRAIVQSNSDNKDITKTSGRGLALIASLWTDHFEINSSEHGGIMVTFNKKAEETTPPHPPLLTQMIEQVPQTIPVPEVTYDNGVQTIPLHEITDEYDINQVMDPVYEEIKKSPEKSKVILDFKNLDYINSTFIGHLAAAYNLARQKTVQLAIQNTNSAINDVLDLVGLSQIFKSY